MDRRLLILAVGMFAMGTDNFVVAGILPGVAASLHTSVSLAGLMVTFYALTYAVAAYQELKPAYPALKKAYAPPWGVSNVLILQLEKRLMRPGIVNNILAASLYTRSGKWKHVIVVDEDINLEDPNEVLWALTTRFQPATDMYIIPRGITSSLEPSATVDGLTSKAMLDLTIKENFRGEVAEPTDAMRQMVLQRWKEYGFK